MFNAQNISIRAKLSLFCSIKLFVLKIKVAIIPKSTMWNGCEDKSWSSAMKKFQYCGWEDFQV